MTWQEELKAALLRAGFEEVKLEYRYKDYSSWSQISVGEWVWEAEATRQSRKWRQPYMVVTRITSSLLTILDSDLVTLQEWVGELVKQACEAWAFGNREGPSAFRLSCKGGQ